jgi:hypothetical protein
VSTRAERAEAALRLSWMTAMEALTMIADPGKTSLRHRRRTYGQGAEKPNCRDVASEALDRIRALHEAAR